MVGVSAGADRLDRFNDDLLQRVNATGEVSLESHRVGRRLMLFVAHGEARGLHGGADRIWEVINDEFRGLLIDSSEHLLRWEFGT